MQMGKKITLNCFGVGVSFLHLYNLLKAEIQNKQQNKQTNKKKHEANGHIKIIAT